MTTDRVLVFALTSLAIIVVPGPSVLFTIGRALSIGRRGAVLTVAGNTVGGYMQVIAVAFGVGALVERSAELFTILKLVGAGFLVFLGIQAIRHRRTAHGVSRGAPGPVRVRRILAQGFLVGLTNPKTIVFFVVALPQFANRDAGHLPTQLLVLGAVFASIGFVSDSIWALAAGTAREWIGRSPSRLAAIGGAGGLTMIGVGTALALTGRKG